MCGIPWHPIPFQTKLQWLCLACSLYSNTCNVSHHFWFVVFSYKCRQIFWNKMSYIHHKWSLLNIISNGFNSLIIFHAWFFKILSHVNITVTFEPDKVSAEHYQYVWGSRPIEKCILAVHMSSHCCDIPWETIRYWIYCSLKMNRQLAIFYMHICDFFTLDVKNIYFHYRYDNFLGMKYIEETSCAIGAGKN